MLPGSDLSALRKACHNLVMSRGSFKLLWPHLLDHVVLNTALQALGFSKTNNQRNFFICLETEWIKMRINASWNTLLFKTLLAQQRARTLIGIKI